MDGKFHIYTNEGRVQKLNFCLKSLSDQKLIFHEILQGIDLSANGHDLVGLINKKNTDLANPSNLERANTAIQNLAFSAYCNPLISQELLEYSYKILTPNNITDAIDLEFTALEKKKEGNLFIQKLVQNNVQLRDYLYFNLIFSYSVHCLGNRLITNSLKILFNRSILSKKNVVKIEKPQHVCRALIDNLSSTEIGDFIDKNQGYLKCNKALFLKLFEADFFNSEQEFFSGVKKAQQFLSLNTPIFASSSVECFVLKQIWFETKPSILAQLILDYGLKFTYYDYKKSAIFEANLNETFKIALKLMKKDNAWEKEKIQEFILNFDSRVQTKDIESIISTTKSGGAIKVTKI